MGERVAFVGLGVMGYPMAGWLRRGGHEMTVFNGTAAMARAGEHEGRVATMPAGAAANSDVLLTWGVDDFGVQKTGRVYATPTRG